MAKETYLFLIIAGQLSLVALDLRERYSSRSQAACVTHLRPASNLFLAVVVVVYGGLQFGGLALAPSLGELHVASQAWVGDLLGMADQRQGVTLPAVLLIGVCGFYFAGLCDYLFHRFASHSRLLWFTHENHHLTTNVAAFMPGLCVRPFAVVAVLPSAAIAIFAVQFALGVTHLNAWDMMPMLYAVALAQSTVLGITHSVWMRRCGPLQRLLRPLGITTPQEHWLHHVSDLDCNYGNFTIIWDRLFGTYVDPETVDVHLHRAGLSYDQDFLGTLTFGRFKLSASFRRRFQVEQSCYLVPQPAPGENVG